MARRGAMAKNPPLRGQARRDFRQAQREAVASGGEMPTQAQFRPKPQFQSQPPAQQQSYDQARQAALGAAQQAMQQQPAQDQGGQMPPDKMYRFPQPAGGQGATLGAVMGNIAGSRSEGMRNPFEPQNNSYWFQGKPNMPGYMGPRPQGGPSMGDVQTTGGNTGFAGNFPTDQFQQYLAQIQQNPQVAQNLGFQNAATLASKRGSMPSMPKQGIQQQLTPEQQAFNDQQRAGNSAVRMQPNGTIAY